MNSIPIERISPEKLGQPPEGLKLQTQYTFLDQEDIKQQNLQKTKSKSKKKRKKGKKKTTTRKTLPPITLAAPSLKNLDEIANSPPVDIEELKSPLKKSHGKLNPNHRPESKILNEEDEFLDFELNDKQEAQDLNDLIAEEIKKLSEQKEQIMELENHVTKDINVIFEPEAKKPGMVVNEDDMLFSMFKDFHATKSPNPRPLQNNDDYSIVNESIKRRLEELQNRTKELDDFRAMIRLCIEKETKFEDDEYANVLENKFNELRTDNDFLNTYKTIKDEDKDQKEEMNKLKMSIIKDKSTYEESKKNLLTIRSKFEGKEKGKVTKDEVRKAKEGLRHELVGMMSSMRNSNCLIDFGKI